MEQTSKDYFIRKIHSDNRKELNFNKDIATYTFLAFANVTGAATILLNNPNAYDFQPYEVAGAICGGIGLLGSLGTIALSIHEYNQSRADNVTSAEKARVYTKQLQRQIIL